MKLKERELFGEEGNRQDGVSFGGGGNSLAQGSWLHFQAGTFCVDPDSVFDSSDPDLQIYSIS